MLHKEPLFKINDSKRLGTMRIDYYYGQLSNKWSPTDLLLKSVELKNIDLAILQKELNYLQFELCEDFPKVLEYTKGVGYDKETHLYFVGEFNYGVRLVPLKSDYSYIYAYRK